jgi:outer membrane protein assembly factor BamB
MTRLCAPAVVALVICSIGGAQASAAVDQTVSWGVNPGHTGFASGATLGAPPLGVRWTRTLGTSVGQPLLAEGKVFVSYYDSARSGTTVAALDAVSGATVWWRQQPSSVDLAYDAGKLYMLSGGGVLTAVTASTGANLWLRTLNEPFDWIRPVATGGRVYVASSWSGGTLHALDGADGTTKWSAGISDGGQPAVAGGSVYVARDYYCGASAFDADSGAHRWTGPSGCYYGGSNWTVADGSRVLASPYVLDAATGAARDTFVATRIPAIAGGTGVYPNGKSLQARDMTTGVGRWDLALPASVASSPTVVNNVVYAGGTDGKLYAADLESGQQLWSTAVTSTTSSVGASGMAVGEGELVVPAGATLTAYASPNLELPDGRDVQITTGPDGPSASASATFTFSASGTGFEYRCRIDNGAWEPCAGSRSFAALRDGPHVFEVKTVKVPAGQDVGLAARSFAVDTQAPTTTVTGGPASPSRYSSATFYVRASESGATTECRIDSGAWGTCSGSKTYYLADGDHVFEARSRDAVGNQEQTPARHAWTIDTRAPDVRVTSGPDGTSRSGSASFEFTSSDSTATFLCSLDSSYPSQACSSPKSYSDLADGRHTFYVTAVDRAGNYSSWASYSWTIDRREPETTITTGPTGTSGSAQATFEFRSDETGARFECRLDGGAFAGCSSPRTHSSLSEGSHTFEVRAVDAGGNTDSTPASRTWTVDAVPDDTRAPDTTISSGPTGTTRASTADFQITADEPNVRIECALDGAAWDTCATYTSRCCLADGEHEFAARAVDAAGNADPTPATRRWTIDTRAPQTTIDASRSGGSGSAAARFEFAADEAGATFECQIDDEPWETCTSPVSYTGLATASHVFRVQATDPVGNRDLTAAEQTFTLARTQAPAASAPHGQTGNAGAAAGGGGGGAPPSSVLIGPPSLVAPPSSARALLAELESRVGDLLPALASGKRVWFDYAATAPGTLTVEIWKRTGGRKVRVARGWRKFEAAGVGTVRLAATGAGRRALRARKGGVTLKVIFATPDGGRDRASRNLR